MADNKFKFPIDISRIGYPRENVTNQTSSEPSSQAVEEPKKDDNEVKVIPYDSQEPEEQEVRKQDEL